MPMLQQPLNLFCKASRLPIYVIIISRSARLQRHAVSRRIHRQQQICMLAVFNRKSTGSINMLLCAFSHRIILIGRQRCAALACSISHIDQRQLILQTRCRTAKQQKAQLVCTGKKTDTLTRQLAHKNIHITRFTMCLRIRRRIIAANQHIIKVAAFHAMQQQLRRMNIISAARI